jgi:hypothetical protein
VSDYIGLFESANDDDSFVAAHQYAIDNGITHALGARRGIASGQIIGQDADCLMIACKDIQTDKLIGLECINAEGQKEFFGNIAGGAKILGNSLDLESPWSVVYGWVNASKMLIRRSKGSPAHVVCFSQSALKETAELIKQHYDPDKIVITTAPPKGYSEKIDRLISPPISNDKRPTMTPVSPSPSKTTPKPALSVIKRYAPLDNSFSSDIYQFVSYSTFKDDKGGGRLVMELKNAKTSDRVKAFFNVNIKGQRCKYKAQYYSIGKKCRFWPADNSKFAKLWEKAFGSDGSSSTIYKRMGKLKQIEFTGKLSIKQDYTELKQIHILR